MRFGLVANLRRVGAAEAIDTLIAWAAKRRQDLIMCDELAGSVPKVDTFLPREKVVASSDVVVSMGGDGTLLAVARSIGSTGTPILGINLGSLGFLTQQTPQQLEEALDAIVNGSYTLDERMVLKADVVGREKLSTPYALNDIVLDNGPTGRLLDINLHVNGEDVVTYKADGIVIATPTGSTAYSLAVGGPIMHPRMDAMIAAPIAAFSLTTRPMIFTGQDVLELHLPTEDRRANLTLDGQVVVMLHAEEYVRISRAEFRVRLIAFKGQSYYQLLKSKLHWGVPPNYRA